MPPTPRKRAVGKPPPKEAPTELELDEAQHDPPIPDTGEVRADEFTRGTGQPVGTSAFSDPVVEVLKQPLDPNRIRLRKGRGGGQFEYLAGHDVKRRLNEVFGFGHWRTEVLANVPIAEVEVRSSSGQEGWHVGYKATVKLSVRGLDGEWAWYTDEGYGDGVEYGAAARVTACELALKEAVTDAIKRAATCLGDQFGLILYAKQDERQRINRERNLDDARAASITKVINRPEQSIPRTWPELAHAFIEGEFVDAIWLAQAIEAKFGKPRAELNREEASIGGQMLQSAYLRLVELEPEDRPDFAGPSRKRLREVFASVLEGKELEGPPWRMGPDEPDLPTEEEWRGLQAGEAAERRKVGEATVDDIPFGKEPPSGDESGQAQGASSE